MKNLMFLVLAGFILVAIVVAAMPEPDDPGIAAEMCIAAGGEGARVGEYWSREGRLVFEGVTSAGMGLCVVEPGLRSASWPDSGRWGRWLP